MNIINTKNNASYNLVAPSIPEDAGKKVELIFPTVETVNLEPDDNGVCQLTVNRQTTIVKFGVLEEGVELDVSVAQKEYKESPDANDASNVQEMIINPQKTNLNIGANVIVAWTSGENASDIAIFMDGERICVLPGEAQTASVKQLIWDGEGFLAI